jgi:hypothetical protein
MKRSENAQIILIGNKKDQKKKISEKEANDFASQNGIQYFETDFEDNVQIEKILNILLKEIYTYEVNILKEYIQKYSFIRTMLRNNVL